MTEETWFTTPPDAGTLYVQSMLDFLGPRLSRRKQVLLACGSFYLRRPGRNDHEHAWERLAREVAERFVDGKATPEELAHVRDSVERALADDPYPTDLMHNTLPDTGNQALNLLRLACGEVNSLAELPTGWVPDVRPFPFDSARRDADFIRDVFGDPFRPPPVVGPGWVARNDGAVASIARRIYEERAFDRLPLLADALQMAGCADEAIVSHCRGPGPHTRGCWVVDLILGAG